YGMYKLFRSDYRIILTPFIIGILCIETIYFWHQYTTQADIYTAIRRNDGFKKLVMFAERQSAQFEEIILPAEGNTALYYLFFTKDFSTEYSSQFQNDAHIDKVGNIRFIKATCPTEVLSEADRKRNILVVNRHSCGENEGYNQVGI